MSIETINFFNVRDKFATLYANKHKNMNDKVNFLENRLQNFSH